MKIESEVARQSRYGDDAIEAFNTAVDNGQARLAMSILVDIVNAFAEKFDELLEEKVSNEQEQEIVKEEVPKKEEVKQKNTATKDESKSVAKEDSALEA